MQVKVKVKVRVRVRVSRVSRYLSCGTCQAPVTKPTYSSASGPQVQVPKIDYSLLPCVRAETTEEKLREINADRATITVPYLSACTTGYIHAHHASSPLSCTPP